MTPDLLVLGKGLSSSLPVSAVIGRRGILDQPQPGDMSSTHGGNPVCAAAALANLQVLEDEQLIENSARTGEAMLNRLRVLQHATAAKRRFTKSVIASLGVANRLLGCLSSSLAIACAHRCACLS